MSPTTDTLSRGCDTEAELTLEPAPNAIVQRVPGGRMVQWVCLSCTTHSLPRSAVSSAIEGATNHLRRQHPSTGEHVEVLEEAR